MTFQEVAPEVNDNQTKLVYSELVGLLPEKVGQTSETDYTWGYNTALEKVKAVLEEYFGVSNPTNVNRKG